MCDILQEGLLTYFKGESVTAAMLRIRGQEGYKRYDLLIDEQTVIGWDNLLTAFMLWRQYFGCPFFTGAYLPQKLDLAPPL
jgi:hypothetical protein